MARSWGAERSKKRSRETGGKKRNHGGPANPGRAFGVG